MGRDSSDQRRRKKAAASKYDADHSAISSAYKEFADLRRELSGSKTQINERTELLKVFSTCADPQRAWLILDDYFEKLSLSRKDFEISDWWGRIISLLGERRLQELAFLFMRSGRVVPPELSAYADVNRFEEIRKSEREKHFSRELEKWLVEDQHLDHTRARNSIKILCNFFRTAEAFESYCLQIKFLLNRPDGIYEEIKPLDLLEIKKRGNYEFNRFTPDDIEFLKWFSLIYSREECQNGESILLSGSRLYMWLIKWGASGRLETKAEPGALVFNGDHARIIPYFETGSDDCFLWFKLIATDGKEIRVEDAKFLNGKPAFCLVGTKFYILESPPPTVFYEYINSKEKLPLRKLTGRTIAYLRKNYPNALVNWDEVCVIHRARPRFIFELDFDVVKVKLEAISERDGSVWHWNGNEWERISGGDYEKPHVLDDENLKEATQWLRRLDLFMQENGVWIGDVSPEFLRVLAEEWQRKPEFADYFGNTAFQRLFLNPKKLKPKIVVKGSGIDWLSVSTEWEIEGMKLTPADIEKLSKTTQRFVKLPDAGWVEVDIESVIKAHEAAAEMGLDGLIPIAEKIPIEQALRIAETDAINFLDSREAEEIKNRLKDFKTVEETPVPLSVKGSLRQYQKDGFNFLCHLTKIGMGGILADDMGLGKTVQTLTWLAYLKEAKGKNFKPALVICPASVLYNWKREIERFTPEFKVLLLESGAERHSLRKKIPQYDVCITNYALLRRDFNELTKFHFSAIILDEAQYIKNPDAQITLAVKKLKADQRIALTGTPLENHLLDLWSIVDFVQPGYLGNQKQFLETYDPPPQGNPEATAIARRISRKRLSAKLRPIMIRRLKQQVAPDLPDRIEERRDCELTDLQRKLYLAELKRSREEISRVVMEKGVGKSKLHVLAALTRLRQICCHPALVGNDASSGKTDILYELLEPLIDEGHKVLVFSQFVQMLKILEKECAARNIKTYMLTGETRERMSVVNAFQAEPNACVFLLSLRAAGTGLNLTDASYVILYDPWWNPAVEAQAIDRSHRIGQTRNVNAYRLITRGTVEEKIWELQQKKSQIIADVLGEEGFARNLTREDIEFLFAE